MNTFQKAYIGLLMLLSILFAYSVGAWADDTTWARCTDGKSIKLCKLTEQGLYINGKLVDAYLYQVVEINGVINILYKEIK